MLNDRELTQIQETGELFLFNKFNAAALLMSLDVLGINAEQVEIKPLSNAVKVTII